MKRDFKGIWISKDIWLSKELSLQEKVFLVEIDSLDNEEGCYANNKYFSEFFGLSQRQVSRIITSLLEKGYIEAEYFNSNTRPRVLRKVWTDPQKGYRQKCPGGIDKNVQHNNTSNNKVFLKENIKRKKFKRTTKPKKKIPIKDFYLEYPFFKDEFAEIWFNEFLPIKKKKDGSLTDRALKSQLKKIAGFSNGDYETALEILERSVNSGWKDFWPLTKPNPYNKPKGLRSGVSGNIDYTSGVKTVYNEF